MLNKLLIPCDQIGPGSSNSCIKYCNVVAMTSDTTKKTTVFLSRKCHQNYVNRGSYSHFHKRSSMFHPILSL